MRGEIERDDFDVLESVKAFHAYWHVLALQIDSNCPTYDYFEEAKKRNGADFRTLVKRIERVAAVLRYQNEEVFKHERGKIYALRPFGGCDSMHSTTMLEVSGSNGPAK